MKKILFLLPLFLILITCEKRTDYLIPSSEVPKWLKDRISHDEEIIKSNPRSGLEIAAWIRYKYNGNYFFEYRNGLSSAGPETLDHDGVQIMFLQAPYLNYNSEKCCKQYVWKGPSYFEI